MFYRVRAQLTIPSSLPMTNPAAKCASDPFRTMSERRILLLSGWHSLPRPEPPASLRWRYPSPRQIDPIGKTLQRLGEQFS